MAAAVQPTVGGTLRKHVTKPFPQPAAPPTIDHGLVQKSHDRKTTDICKLRSVRRPRRHEQPHRKEAPLQLDQL